jgi:hypothetical protein
MSFVPNPVLDSRFKSSKYNRIHPKGTSYGRLRAETQVRLDLDEDPTLFAGKQNPIFEMGSIS